MAATLLAIVVTAGLSFLPVRSTAAPPTTVVGAAGQTKTAEIAAPGGSVKLQCPEEGYVVKPTVSASVSNVCVDAECGQQVQLQELCPGATGTPITGTTKGVTLTLPQLPNTSKTFYLQCTKDDNTATFSVLAKEPPPEGPQVCEVGGTTVTLAVKGETGATQFKCGEGRTLSPTTAGKVYKDDCKKEEDLKDLVFTPSPDSYNKLAATKKPKKDKKICYLCTQAAKGAGADACAVMISVSAGSGMAARSVFGLALPCVLALLHFT